MTAIGLHRYLFRSSPCRRHRPSLQTTPRHKPQRYCSPMRSPSVQGSDDETRCPSKNLLHHGTTRSSKPLRPAGTKSSSSYHVRRSGSMGTTEASARSSKKLLSYRICSGAVPGVAAWALRAIGARTILEPSLSVSWMACPWSSWMSWSAASQRRRT